MLFSIPVSNAFVERVFSLVPSQWSKERNRLCERTVKSLLQVRDVEAEAGSGSCGSGTFSAEAEAVPLKMNRFRFHSDQGFPTEGEFHTWEEFYS